MATIRVRFLPNGTVKLEVAGAVPEEVHDAVEQDLDTLASRLGERRASWPLDPDEAHHAHAHRHGISHRH